MLDQCVDDGLSIFAPHPHEHHEKAQEAALQLRVEFEHTHNGYAGLAEAIRQRTRNVVETKTGQAELQMGT